MLTRVCAIRHDVPMPGRFVRTWGVCALVCCLTTAAQAQPEETSEAEPESSTPSDVVDGAMPLITEAEVEDWTRNHRLRFSEALRADRLSPEQQQELDLGARVHLYRLTMSENNEEIHDIAQKLVEDLKSVVTKQEPRDYLNAQIVEVSKELLDQPADVRRTVMILLASLSSDPRAKPPTPYVPAVDVMSIVLNDPEQFIDCKLCAANGMGRIARDGNPPIRIKSQIATDLVAALADSKADNEFYRLRLIDALGNCGTMYNITRQPIVIDALMSMIRDADERPMLRANAVRAVTQLPWEADTNVPLIVYEVCRLAHELMQKRNEELSRVGPKKLPAHWRYTTINFYMAFNPETAEQKARGWGLNNRGNTALVQSAYQVVLPVVNTVMQVKAPNPVPANQLKALEGWLQDYQPASWKVTPNSKELPRSEPEGQPMAGDSATNDSSVTPVAAVPQQP